MNEFELTTLQIAILEEVYQKRKNLLYSTVLGLPALMLVYCYQIYPFYLDASPQQQPYYVIITLLIFCGLVVLLLCLLHLRLAPLKKDIEQKTGEYLKVTITRKSEFVHVEEFYFFFDNSSFPHKQVDASEFNNYMVGELYFLPIGKHSKIILDLFRKYNLL